MPNAYVVSYLRMRIPQRMQWIFRMKAFFVYPCLKAVDLTTLREVSEHKVLFPFSKAGSDEKYYPVRCFT